jgi:RNA recognition motif-containing protein
LQTIEKLATKRDATFVDANSIVAKDSSTNKRTKTKQPLWVRVFGLNYETVEADVRKFFEACGPIMKVDFPIFIKSGRSKGYCGVLFQSPKAVAKAVELDGQDLMGRWLQVQAGKMLLDQWEQREEEVTNNKNNSKQEVE